MVQTKSIRNNIFMIPRLNYILFLCVQISILSSCIDPYFPSFDNRTKAKYVVYGQITDQEGYQTISISKTSTVSSPKYNPVSNCIVKIIDIQGNIFTLNEYDPGSYRVWMSKEQLSPDNSYQVQIQTETGIKIESEFDQMNDSPELDSVYYIREDIPTSNPEKPLQGIQFYIDVDGRNINSHYYKWEIEETWEHHAVYPKTLFWNRLTIIKYIPPDYSSFYCWTTQKVKNIFTFSTQNLTQNMFKKHKLHFVDNQTQRLTYCYSILVSQYAISESAYNFWEKLRLNSEEEGGLYNTQPLNAKGNLKSTTNPELEVLGFFCAASVKSKRIFVRNVENLERFYDKCEPAELQKGDLNKSAILYLMQQDGEFVVLQPQCVICNLFSGTTVKPNFWPY